MFIARGPETWQAKKSKFVVFLGLGLVLHIFGVVVSTNLHGYRDRFPPLAHARYSWDASLDQRDNEIPPCDNLIGVRLQ